MNEPTDPREQTPTSPTDISGSTTSTSEAPNDAADDAAIGAPAENGGAGSSVESAPQASAEAIPVGGSSKGGADGAIGNGQEKYAGDSSESAGDTPAADAASQTEATITQAGTQTGGDAQKSATDKKEAPGRKGKRPSGKKDAPGRSISKGPADIPPFGVQLSGKVLEVKDGFLMLDVGLSAPAAVSLAQAVGDAPPEPGTVMSVVVDRFDADKGFVRVLAKEEEDELKELFGEIRPGVVLEGRVSGLIKGGLEVQFEKIRGFMPASHVNTTRLKDISVLLSEEVQCEVLELDPRNQKIIVSRKKVQERERKEARKRLIHDLKVGDVRKGRVINLTEYGAFVDLDGVHGLVHVTDMRWTHVEKAEDVLKVGDMVDVKVLRINADRKRISLGMKQLTPDPWKELAEKFPEGTVAPFEVVKLADFGAFAKMTDDVTGLIPLSEMSWNRRPMKAEEVVNVGAKVHAKVISIDAKRHRVSLSLRQVGEDPWKGVAERFEVGKSVTGKVSRLLEFGAIVEFETDLEGMIHVSELEHTRVNKPSDVLSIGQEVEAQVLGVDAGKRKISLSRKALLESPTPEPSPTPAAPKKKRAKPLRGGLASHFDW